MASNPSLRDLYNPPSTQWTFIPPPSSSVPKQAAANASTSYQWTTRPAPSSIFDLSPSLNVGEPSSLDVSLIFRSLVASALLQYCSTAMAMPLEVGKLLLQVQWVPKDALTQEPEEEAEEETETVGQILSDIQSADAFCSLAKQQTKRRHTLSNPALFRLAIQPPNSWTTGGI